MYMKPLAAASMIDTIFGPAPIFVRSGNNGPSARNPFKCGNLHWRMTGVKKITHNNRGQRLKVPYYVKTGTFVRPA